MAEKGNEKVLFFSAMAIGALFAPTLAVAADPGNVFTLGEIEVSEMADEVSKNPTVDRVYAEEIHSFDRNTIADAVNLLPGVTASVTGARNEQTIYVRGLDIKHVPLFVDGIPVYVPYDGYPDLARFTTFDLSEVIVAKGFTSVLYGPNTMGGAINMVSRRPQKAFEGDAGAGISSGDTYYGYANLGTAQEKWFLQTGASYLDSSYFPLSDDFTPTKTENGGHRDNSYRQDGKINLKAGFTPNKTDEYAFSFIDQRGEKGTPPYTGKDRTVTARFWQWPYWDKQSYYFNSKTDFAGTAYLKTRAYHDIFQNSLSSYDDATYTTITKKFAFKSWYDDYTDGGSLEAGTSFLPDNLLKLALHYKRDVHREQNEGFPELTFRDQMFSVGLEDKYDFTKKFYGITGISYDYLDTLDAEEISAKGTIVDFPMESTSGLNPQLGLFYKPGETDTLHMAVARKTRLPSIKDKYSYRLGTAIPNPDLDPEKSVNYEIGYENKKVAGFLNMQTILFYNNVTDYIQSAKVADPKNPGKTTDQNQNIAEVDLSGVELEVGVELLTALEIGGNYTYTHVDNTTDDNKITNVPEHKVFGYLRYTLFEKLMAQVDAEYDSKRYSSSNGVQVADGYVVANAKIGYDIGKGLWVDAGVKNLFDENYEIQEGYPEAGRTLFANLRYTF
jgi:iron complex outermembrane recepter protein